MANNPAWDDLDVFIDLNDFGTLATCMADGGTGIPFTVQGIFDEPVQNAKLGEFDMAGSKPCFRCKQVDAVTLKKHDKLVVFGRAYFLDHDPHPDGFGMARLELGLDTDEVPS